MASGSSQKTVLHVGCGGVRDLPAHYEGWEQLTLDIDPEAKTTYCMDALDIEVQLTALKVDAVYSCHMLEHFYAHDVPRVLAGFRSVLREGGFIDIVVPDIMVVLRDMAERDLTLNDVYYRNGGGIPIRFHDVLYGWDAAMRKGNLYFAHRCGFSPVTLGEALTGAGFEDIKMFHRGHNLFAMATKG